MVVEVGGGQGVVGAVLDPQHERLAGRDHDVTGNGRPDARRALDGVEVIDRVVGEVDRITRGVVDLDELEGVGARDVGRVGQQLGDLQRCGDDARVGLRVEPRLSSRLLSRGRGDGFGCDDAGRRRSRLGEDVRAAVDALSGQTEVRRLSGGGRRAAVGRPAHDPVVLQDADAARRAVGHSGLPRHAHHGGVGAGAPVRAELVHRAGEGVDAPRGVAEPEHDGPPGGDHDRVGHGERNVAGAVGTVDIRVRERDALSRQVDVGGTAVVDLEELVVVDADVVGGDLGHDERAGCRVGRGRHGSGGSRERGRCEREREGSRGERRRRRDGKKTGAWALSGHDKPPSVQEGCRRR
ncbi:hypothetical protein QE367_003114 [Microbacterium paludicola]|uniref:Uncharacterized protein n=1 Tax=Microbacterium paludicola TaxID=300019 RepID=A0ABU1I4V0_9MICO|nr:hypothetical protein [Microbacterium paludicola]